MPNNRKARTIFVIDKDIIKQDTQGAKLWQHKIVKRGRISKLRLEQNNYTLTIINVYMLNTRLEKAKIIEILRNSP